MFRKSLCSLAALVFCAAILSGCAAPAASPVASSPRPATASPQIDGDHLPFSARYYRTNGYAEGKDYPVVTLIQSTEDAKAYYEANKNTYRMEGPTPGFADALLGYDDAYFREHLLIIVLLEEPSGSIRHKVTDVVQTDDHTRVLIQRVRPEGAATADMAQWHILIEIGEQGYAGIKADASIFE